MWNSKIYVSNQNLQQTKDESIQIFKYNYKETNVLSLLMDQYSFWNKSRIKLANEVGRSTRTNVFKIRCLCGIKKYYSVHYCSFNIDNDKNAKA